MAGVDDVLYVSMTREVDDAGFDVLMRELARAIDERSDDVRVGVIFDVADVVGMDARRRKRVGETLNPREKKLAATTAAFVLVSASAVLRGALRAVFWIAPPSYPAEIAGTLREALELLARHLPAFDVESMHRAILALPRAHELPRAASRS